MTLGSWVSIPNPIIAEIMARAGFDWLAIDMEHGPINTESMHHLIQIIDLCGVVPLVRVPNHDPFFIKRALDAGAHGVIVPFVNTPEEARQVQATVMYPPAGQRGMGLARAQAYGERFLAYVEEHQRRAVIIAQIEGRDGVKHITEILKAGGVDGVMIGPYDLSGSLGVPAQFDHARMREATGRVLRAATAASVATGFHVIRPSVEEARRRVQEGYTFIAYSSDMLMLAASSKDAIAPLIPQRQAAPGRPRRSKGART